MSVRLMLVIVLAVCCWAALVGCSFWLAKGNRLRTLAPYQRWLMGAGLIGPLVGLLACVALLGSGLRSEQLTFTSARVAGGSVPLLTDTHGRVWKATDTVAATLDFHVAYICQVQTSGALGVGQVDSCQLAN